MTFLPRGENSKSCRWFLNFLNRASLSSSILLALICYKSLIILSSFIPLNKMRTIFKNCFWWSCSVSVCISEFLRTHCFIAINVWCAFFSTLAVCHFCFSWAIQTSLLSAFLHSLVIFMCLCFTVCPWGNKLPRASAQQAKRESSAAVGRASCQQKLYAQSVSIVFTIPYSKQSDKGKALTVFALKLFLWCVWGKTEMWNATAVLRPHSVVCLNNDLLCWL